MGPEFGIGVKEIQSYSLLTSSKLKLMLVKVHEKRGMKTGPVIEEGMKIKYN